MKTAKSLILAVASFVVTLSASAQLTTFGTGDASTWSTVYNSNYGFAPFEAGTAAWAQTFTLGSSATLSEFAFHIRKGDNGDVNFSAAIVEWSVDHATNVLWTGTNATDSSWASGSEHWAEFTSVNLPLSGSRTYALLLMADNTNGDDNAYFGLGLVDGTGYAGGNAFTYYTPPPGLDSMSDFVDSPVRAWAASSPSSDLAFAITLSGVTPVPEPMVPGLALGMGGLAAYVAWRRKRAAVAAVVAKPAA